MQLATLCLSFVIGCLLGSFYNVCILRYVSDESILWPPSHCPRCNHRLSPLELIPVLSWAMQGGRCKHCRGAISAQYPIVELISGLWALALASTYGIFTPAWFVYMVMGGIFIVASGIDLHLFILPDILTLPGAVLAIALSTLVLGVPLRDSLIGAGVAGGVFWSLQSAFRYLRGREGLGTGDIKLMVLIGGLLGWQALPMVILLGSVTALIPAVYKAMSARAVTPDSTSIAGDQNEPTQQKDDLPNVQTQEDDEDYIDPALIPFGPFLSLGAMLAIIVMSR